MREQQRPPTMCLKTQLVVRHVIKRRILTLVGPMSQNVLASELLRQLETEGFQDGVAPGQM